MPIGTSCEAVIMYRYLDIPPNSVIAMLLFSLSFLFEATKTQVCITYYVLGSILSTLGMFWFSPAVVLRQLVLHNEQWEKHCSLWPCLICTLS